MPMKKSMYSDVEILTSQLSRLADEIELQFDGKDLYLSPRLIDAARRIASLGEVYRTRTAAASMPLARAVIYLTRRGEEVTATELRERLSESGRQASIRAVNVALHRACRQEELVRSRRGVYRRPTPTDIKEAEERARTQTRMETRN